MKKFWRRENVLTIPNALSLLRILLIPPIVSAYRHHSTSLTILLLAMSAMSDIADGVIARRFHMISDLGKILDPIADKLTQIAMVVCLFYRRNRMLVLLVLMGIKELLLALYGYLALKRKKVVNSSKWYGKVCTVIIYTTVILLILFPSISSEAANRLIGLCCGAVFLSTLLYSRFYLRFFQLSSLCRTKNHRKEPY